MLCISGEDIVEAVSRSEVMDTIEDTMVGYERGSYLMPQRAHVERGEDALLLMPCFGEDMFGTKLVTVFPGNAQRDLPVVDGAVVLNDGATGEIRAVINGRVLTGLRTGAVGGVSVRHLATAESTSIGIVGAGVQGYYQALFAASAADVREVWIFDIDGGNADALAEKLTRELPSVAVHVAADVGQLLEKSGIVITATTSGEPVLPDDPAGFSGRHFVAVGSFQPHMRELPAALFRSVSRFFVDTDHAVEESGDVGVPLERGWLERDSIETMGSFLAKGDGQDDLREQTTVFKTVGMAAFDLTVSQLVYERAAQKGLGSEIAL